MGSAVPFSKCCPGWIYMKTFGYPQSQATWYGQCTKISDMIDGICGFLRHAGQSGYHNSMLHVKHTCNLNQEGTCSYGASNVDLASRKE
jgi:hypothetical protein